MGQDASQEAPTDSANTPADPTRTPSEGEPNSVNRVFGEIAEAMDASQNRLKKSKKQKRKDKKARELASSQAMVDAPQQQAQGAALEPKSPTRTPAPDNPQSLSGEAAVDTEQIDVVPESSLPFPTTPSVGDKKKMKTFMSAQKKKILLEQINEHEPDAVPPTQPSQAEETQVQNSYEPKEGYMPHPATNSEDGSIALSGAEENEQDVDADTDAGASVEIKKSKKSKMDQKQKRRLPIDDVADTPSKRARLDIQTPPEPEPSKSMIKQAKQKADLAEENRGYEKNAGVLSEEDWKTIDLQLEKYRAIHNLTVEEQNRLIQGNLSGKDSPSAALFNWVMEEIHNRRRWSVIKAMRRKYHDFDKRGAWAPEDDEELMVVYKRLPKKWKEIGNLLNRLPDDCRDRWRYVLECGTNIHFGRWSLEEEQLLMKVVNEALCELRAARQERALESDEEGPAKPLDDTAEVNLLDWAAISERLGHRRGRRQCSEKYKILQRRTPSRWAYYAKHQGKAILQASKMNLKDKINLLKALQKFAIKEEEEVHWDDIAQEIIDHDEEGHISKLSPKLSATAVERAWQKLKYLLENANSLEFPYIINALLEKLENCGGQDPSEHLFEARIGDLDLQEKIGTLQTPAKRTKKNIVQAAAMTLEEKRNMLAQLQASGVQKQDQVDWLMFLNGHGFRGKSPGCEVIKLAWEKLSSFMDSAEEQAPTEFQDRVQFMLEKLNFADGQDPTKAYFMEDVEKKSLQDDLEKLEKKKSAQMSAARNGAVKKPATMPVRAKLIILNALRDSGVRDEKEIVWTKHGGSSYMKRGIWNTHEQREMLKDLKTTVDNADDLDFPDLLDHLIEQLEASRAQKSAEAKTPLSDTPKRKYAKKTRSSNVVEESDNEVDDDVLDSLNAAVNPKDDEDAEFGVHEQGSAPDSASPVRPARKSRKSKQRVEIPSPDAAATSEHDAEGEAAADEDEAAPAPVSPVLSPKKSKKSKKRANSPAAAEISEPETEPDGAADEDEATAASVSPLISPSPKTSKKSKRRAESPTRTQLRKDLYEFNEDEMEDIVLKSAMKRRTPKRIDESAEDEDDEVQGTPEVNHEVEDEVVEDVVTPDSAPTPSIPFSPSRGERGTSRKDRRTRVTAIQEDSVSVVPVEDLDEGTRSNTSVIDEDLAHPADATENIAEAAATKSDAGNSDIPAHLPLAQTSSHKKKKSKKEKRRREEVDDSQEDEGPSALDILHSLQGSQVKVASAPKPAPPVEEAAPPTSSMLPTMSQAIRQTRTKKVKRQSNVPEIPETQQDETIAANDAAAMPPPSSMPAPFPDIPATDDDDMPPPSSMIPPSSPPQPLTRNGTKAKKAEKVHLTREERAAAQTLAEKFVRPRPSLGPDDLVPSAAMQEDPFAALLTKSLKRTRKSLKREAETTVEELEADEERDQANVKSVPAFTPRASKRERKPTHKAMTPYK